MHLTLTSSKMDLYEMPPRSDNYRRRGTNTLEVSMQSKSTRPKLSIAERFWRNVSRGSSPDDCWIWTGNIHPVHGYGHFQWDTKHYSVHRLSYELHKGPIPAGLHIDHLCRVRHCVNPDHLEAVTPRENTRRGLHGVLLTACINGHEYTPENTGRERGGKRFCRICARKKVRDYELRRKARAL